MKDGTIIKIDEEAKEKSWIGIDPKNREVNIRQREGNRIRMTIMMENVNFIDYENSEKTGINIKIFPGVR